MEKPRPADQHQRSIGPLTTSFGKPVTPKHSPYYPTKQTNDARNKAAAGGAHMPGLPVATNTRTFGGPWGSSSLITRVPLGTTLGPSLSTTLTPL